MPIFYTVYKPQSRIDASDLIDISQKRSALSERSFDINLTMVLFICVTSREDNRLTMLLSILLYPLRTSHRRGCISSAQE